MISPVLSTYDWPTNGHLISDVAKLGYLDGAVLDLSYGHGNFWNEWSPERLVANDLDSNKGEHSWDVRHLVPCHWESAFQATVWDGPYRLSGARDLGSFDERYGTGRPATIKETMSLLRAGLRFGLVTTETGGYVLVKCQDQVSSGKKVWQTRMLANYGEANGSRLVDQFHFVNNSRPQPHGRRQVHSRSNTSTLLVFKKLSGEPKT